MSEVIVPVLTVLLRDLSWTSQTNLAPA